MYQYKGKVTNVVDGDTIDIDLDLGFDAGLKSRFRLKGVDTAEKNYPFGKATKEWLAAQLVGKTFIVNSFKHDKYGRWLCDLYIDLESPSINDQMIKAGIAKAYLGDTKSGLWTTDELAKADPIFLALI